MTTVEAAKNAKKEQKLKLAERKRHSKNRQIAYLIHEKLHLTFGQCIQLLDTRYEHGHLIANRNINKLNRENIDNQFHVPLSEFDQGTFNELLKKQVEFASTAAEFVA